jgi:hypothetical protein
VSVLNPRSPLISDGVFLARRCLKAAVFSTMAHPGRHRRAFHRRVSTQNRACDDPHTAPHLRRRSSARRRAPHPLAVLRARSRQGSRLIHDREHLDFDQLLGLAELQHGDVGRGRLVVEGREVAVDHPRGAADVRSPRPRSARSAAAPAMRPLRQSSTARRGRRRNGRETAAARAAPREWRDRRQ